MDLEEMSIVVRERGVFELYELSLLVIRRHLWGLACITLITGLPVAGLQWLILRLIPEDNWVVILPWLVLASACLPLQTGAVSAYIGSAMFSRKPQLGASLMLSLRKLPLLTTAGILRGLCTLLFGFGLFFYPIHLQECILLERQNLGESLRRAWRLNVYYMQENIAHLLLNLLIAIGALLVLALAAWFLFQTLQWNADPVHDYLARFHPAHGWSLLASLPLMTAFGVFRFCTYIDLRTRREGWELELAMRRAARRLQEGAA